MKKALITLVVLALAAPLYASTIEFTATDTAIGECTISYTCTDAAAVAMGLDVDMDAAAEADIYQIDSFFDIFMDLAFDEEGGDGYDYGEGNGDASNAGADQDAAGQATLPAESFCISMGGLGGETEPLNDPCMAGQIVLQAAPNGATGTLDLNALRGGVIDENGDTMTVIGLPLTLTFGGGELDCYQEAGRDITHPAEYADWLAFGSPECWCYVRQCHGDADGTSTGTAFLGYQFVSVPDLDTLAAGYLVKEPKVGKTWPGILSITGPTGTPGICADFKRNATGTAFLGYQRVSVPDLDELALYYLVKEPKVGKTWPGVPADCLPGNRAPAP